MVVRRDASLVIEITTTGRRRRRGQRTGLAGLADRVPASTDRWTCRARSVGRPSSDPVEAPVRVVIAEDSGPPPRRAQRLLADADSKSSAAVGDGVELLDAVEGRSPTS